MKVNVVVVCRRYVGGSGWQGKRRGGGNLEGGAFNRAGTDLVLALGLEVGQPTCGESQQGQWKEEMEDIYFIRGQVT